MAGARAPSAKHEHRWLSRLTAHTYTSEIDQLIDLNDQEADEAHAAFIAGQAAVRR